MGTGVQKTLPDDVTLGDLVSKLAAPERFVRSVIGVMHSAAKEHGEIVIRVGTTGTGSKPNYRIEEATTNAPVKAIDGNTHGAWTGVEDFTMPANWSNKVMTRAEVEDVLSSITGFKRGKCQEVPKSPTGSKAPCRRRTYGKLRMSPAVAAGIATTFLGFEDVIARIDPAQAPKPRGPSKREALSK